MMQRGFSLIEAVILIGVSAVALAALANLFFIFNSIYGYQQVFMATAGSSGTAMTALEAAILPAERVLASHLFNGTEYTSATTTLVLGLPAIDNSGDILPNVKDYVAFYASSTELYRIIEAGAGSVRSSGIKRLSTTLSFIEFTYDASPVTESASVTTDLQTQSTYKQQAVQSHLNERVYLRNFQSPL